MREHRLSFSKTQILLRVLNNKILKKWSRKKIYNILNLIKEYQTDNPEFYNEMYKYYSVYYKTISDSLFWFPTTLQAEVIS